MRSAPTSIRAIIIDDEENSRETLRLKLQRHCPEVEVLALCADAEEGKAQIEALRPELVFLDIEMPRASGFDLLEDLEDINFRVVFTTAYDQYALRAIKFSALDYLLKPINKEDLQKAVARAIAQKQPVDGEQVQTLTGYLRPERKALDKIALPTADGLIFLPLDQIVRLESEANYTRFFLLQGRPVLVSKTLGDYEELLSGHNFFRPHKSHIINLKYVRQYIRGEGGQIVLEDNSVVDVSRRKKEEFLSRIKEG